MGLGVWGLGFTVQGLGFMVHGLWFMVQDFGFEVLILGRGVTSVRAPGWGLGAPTAVVSLVWTFHLFKVKGLGSGI
jgi:hypothetical protein